MTLGCTQLSANNYTSSADTWDYSCQYVLKVNGICYLFQDIQDRVDNSFTLSFSAEGNNWVFFHDFLPDYYFHTREKLFNSRYIFQYIHNEGLYGHYHDQQFDDGVSIKPFFIDVVFNAGQELILETVDWVSSVLADSSDASNVGSEWNTLTHISIWNSQQHTGRIALQDVFKDVQYQTSRNLDGQWSFNDFRNIVTTRGTQFIKDLFNDYALDPAMTSTKPWYEKELMQDKYMIVRFEFDNSDQKQLLLHDTSIQAIKAKR